MLDRGQAQGCRGVTSQDDSPFYGQTAYHLGWVNEQLQPARLSPGKFHDDIEDRDEWRRHRRTVWAVWGVAQGINTGDAMVFLARLALWEVVGRGVTSDRALQLARILDRT